MTIDEAKAAVRYGLKVRDTDYEGSLETMYCIGNYYENGWKNYGFLRSLVSNSSSKQRLNKIELVEPLPEENIDL